MSTAIKITLQSWAKALQHNVLHVKRPTKPPVANPWRKNRTIRHERHTVLTPTCSCRFHASLKQIFDPADAECRHPDHTPYLHPIMRNSSNQFPAQGIRISQMTREKLNHYKMFWLETTSARIEEDDHQYNENATDGKSITLDSGVHPIHTPRSTSMMILFRHTAYSHTATRAKTKATHRNVITFNANNINISISAIVKPHIRDTLLSVHDLTRQLDEVISHHTRYKSNCMMEGDNGSE